jgi:hypothetical protein
LASSYASCSSIVDSSSSLGEADEGSEELQADRPFSSGPWLSDVVSSFADVISGLASELILWLTLVMTGLGEEMLVIAVSSLRFRELLLCVTGSELLLVELVFKYVRDS